LVVRLADFANCYRLLKGFFKQPLRRTLPDAIRDPAFKPAIWRYGTGHRRCASLRSGPKEWWT